MSRTDHALTVMTDHLKFSCIVGPKSLEPQVIVFMFSLVFYDCFFSFFLVVFYEHVDLMLPILERSYCTPFMLQILCSFLSCCSNV